MIQISAFSMTFFASFIFCALSSASLSVVVGGHGVLAFHAPYYYRRLAHTNIVIASSSSSTSSSSLPKLGDVNIVHPLNYPYHPSSYYCRRCSFHTNIFLQKHNKHSDVNMDGNSSSSIALSSSLSTSLFPTSSKLSSSSSSIIHTLISNPIFQKLRRKFTMLLTTLALFLSLLSPAHASSSSSTLTTTTTPYYQTIKHQQQQQQLTTSTFARINPFRTKSINEMIDTYVQSKLFEDDIYDPIESAYREASSDYSSHATSSTSAVSTIIGKKMMDSSSNGGEGGNGAYPTLLAETVNAALGQQRSASSLLSSSSSSASMQLSNRDPNMMKKNDSLTSILIQVSDVLQSKLGVSASTSYTMVAAVGIVGICVIPAGLGVLYQSIQRMQIDRSEMKMYGKITDLDATSKKEIDDDEDEDEEDD